MNSFNTLTRNLNTKPNEYKYTTIANYYTPTYSTNYSICLDTSSNLYYANATMDGNIYKIDTKILTPTPTTYYTSIDSYTAPQMNPDSNNTLYVTDSLTTTFRLSKITNGTKETFVSTSTNTAFVAFDNSNNIFTSTAVTGISVYLSPNYTTVHSILPSAGGSVPYANIAADGSTKASDLKNPTSVRYRYIPFVNNGILYVSCADFIVQMKLSDIYANYGNPGNIPIYKFAGNGTVATITTDINGLLATAITFNSSRGMAFDKFGNVFISDYDSKMIFKVNLATNRISLFIAPTSAYNPKITTTLFSTGPFYISIDTNRNKLYISNFGTPANILVVS